MDYQTFWCPLMMIIVTLVYAQEHASVLLNFIKTENFGEGGVFMMLPQEEQFMTKLDLYGKFMYL